MASAQEVAGTQGIVIRVENPAANTWAKIGDKIVIRVLTYDGRLHDWFRGLGQRFRPCRRTPRVVRRDGIHYTTNVRSVLATGVDNPDHS